jgi:hypothetical protein
MALSDTQPAMPAATNGHANGSGHLNGDHPKLSWRKVEDAIIRSSVPEQASPQDVSYLVSARNELCQRIIPKKLAADHISMDSLVAVSGGDSSFLSDGFLHAFSNASQKTAAQVRKLAFVHSALLRVGGHEPLGNPVDQAICDAALHPDAWRGARQRPTPTREAACNALQ